LIISGSWLLGRFSPTQMQYTPNVGGLYQCFLSLTKSSTMMRGWELGILQTSKKKEKGSCMGIDHNNARSKDPCSLGLHDSHLFQHRFPSVKDPT
jgi:hypothetical protein